MAKISKINQEILQNYEDDEFPEIQKYDGLTKVFDPDCTARVDEIVDARQLNKIQYKSNNIMFVILFNRVFCGNSGRLAAEIRRLAEGANSVQGHLSAGRNFPES